MHNYCLDLLGHLLAISMSARLAVFLPDYFHIAWRSSSRETLVFTSEWSVQPNSSYVMMGLAPKPKHEYADW